MEFIKEDKYCPCCDYATSDVLNFYKHLDTNRHKINCGDIEYVPRKPIVRRKSTDERDIKIKDGEVRIIPNVEHNQTDSLFVAGPRGCGKSNFSANYIRDYLVKFPKNRFILFSSKDKDEPLDALTPIRVKLDDKLLKKPLKLSDLKNSVVLFDDIDKISNKDVKKEIVRLFETSLNDGRSFNITPIITYHQITDYRNTRELLNGSSYCVIFPKSGAVAQTEYMLKTYCGLKRKQIDKIMKLDTRAAIIKKTAPMAVIYNKGIYLL